jgi:hypothetical protein
MILTFRRSNFGLIFATYPSSVVHTGVKSFGCENSTAHESPIQSWKPMRPLRRVRLEVRRRLQSHLILLCALATP